MVHLEKKTYEAGAMSYTCNEHEKKLASGEPLEFTIEIISGEVVHRVRYSSITAIQTLAIACF